MICKYCNNKIKENATFCNHCGKKIEIAKEKIYCTRCGEEILSVASFCPKCGCKNKRNLLKTDNIISKNNTQLTSQNFKTDTSNFAQTKLVASTQNPSMHPVQMESNFNNNFIQGNFKNNIINQQINNHELINNIDSKIYHIQDNNQVNNDNLADTKEDSKNKKKLIILASLVLAFIMICTIIIVVAVKINKSNSTENIVSSTLSNSNTSYGSYVSQIKEDLKKTGLYDYSSNVYYKEYEGANNSSLKHTVVLEYNVSKNELYITSKTEGNTDDYILKITLPNKSSTYMDFTFEIKNSNSGLVFQGYGKLKPANYMSYFYIDRYTDSSYISKSTAGDLARQLLKMFLELKILNESSLGFKP